MRRIRRPLPLVRRFDLAGKVAVVTGGIGLGTARGLAECGAAVVVAGRNAAKNEAAVAELATLGGLAVAAASAVVDVTDEEQCRAMVAEAVRRHGRLDILVNNAGRGGSGKPPHETPMAEWRAVVDANLTSVAMHSQAAYPEMKRAGGGKIVNVASLAAVLAMPTMAA